MLSPNTNLEKPNTGIDELSETASYVCLKPRVSASACPCSAYLNSDVSVPPDTVISPMYEFESQLYPALAVSMPLVHGLSDIYTAPSTAYCFSTDIPFRQYVPAVETGRKRPRA